jgi:hypothetical protein
MPGLSKFWDVSAEVDESTEIEAADADMPESMAEEIESTGEFVDDDWPNLYSAALGLPCNCFKHRLEPHIGCPRF